MFNSIYIYGLGMMGGSLARSIKEMNISNKVYAYDTDKKSLSYAKKYKIIDNYDNTNFKYLSDADLIIICTPVSCYKAIFRNIKKFKKSNAIITDIGSTKSTIIDGYNSVFKSNEGSFIGSHPLTGKESSSVINSDLDVFKNSVILITPIENKDSNLAKTISKFWKKFNCQIFTIDPKTHDLVLSETSHLPHLVSFALVNIILNTKSIDNISDYIGGGFKDFARLAHSDSKMWRDICFSNEKNIIRSINLLKKELDLIKSLVSNKDKRLAKYLRDIKIKLEQNDK